VKKKSTLGGVFRFYKKKFILPPFSVYKWSIPVVFGNSVFVPNSFPSFSVLFFVRGKREGRQILVKKEKVVVDHNFGHQNGWN
jgi:hypothetical protein